MEITLTFYEIDCVGNQWYVRQDDGSWLSCALEHDGLVLASTQILFADCLGGLRTGQKFLSQLEELVRMKEKYGMPDAVRRLLPFLEKARREIAGGVGQ